MAGFGRRTAFVHINALAVSRGAESGGTLADGLAVLHLADAVVAFHPLARIVALVRLPVAGSVSRTVLVLNAVDAETAELGICRITTSVGRAGARGLMVNDRAESIGAARGGRARVGANPWASR